MDLQTYNKEFARIYKEFDDLYHEIAFHLGLSDSAFEILYSVAVCGEGCTQKEICQLSCTKKQTINSAIQKMAKDGVLKLEQGKGRRVYVFLTEEGRQMVAHKIEPVIQSEIAVFAEMTPQERAEFLRLNEKYISLLRKKVYRRE